MNCGYPKGLRPSSNHSLDVSQRVLEDVGLERAASSDWLRPSALIEGNQAVELQLQAGLLPQRPLPQPPCPTMTLQLRTKARLLDLHCSVGLTDWDMDKELKLATTTDQIYHDDKVSDQYVVQRPSARASRRKDEFVWYDKISDTFVKPNLWLLVNPSIACPIQYGGAPPDLQTVSEPAGEAIQTGPAQVRRPPPSQPHVSGAQEGLSSDYKITKNTRPPVKSRRKGRTTVIKDFKNLKPGCWPRPPVNYCILIALALRSSHTGSLKVQQIYHFTRENFPFFQTAPDGWKNTIRHNLCFNSSFRKTCNQMCRDGKRKSCFWHLTADGQRRLMDEISTLPGETFKQLERSMSHPDVIRTLISL